MQQVIEVHRPHLHTHLYYNQCSFICYTPDYIHENHSNKFNY